MTFSRYPERRGGRWEVPELRNQHLVTSPVPSVCVAEISRHRLDGLNQQLIIVPTPDKGRSSLAGDVRGSRYQIVCAQKYVHGFCSLRSFFI